MSGEYNCLFTQLSCELSLTMIKYKHTHTVIPLLVAALTKAIVLMWQQFVGKCAGPYGGVVVVVEGRGGGEVSGIVSCQPLKTMSPL